MQIPFPTAVLPHGFLTDIHSAHSRIFIGHLLCALTEYGNERQSPCPCWGKKSHQEKKQKLLGSMTDSHTNSSIHGLGDLILQLGKLPNFSKASTASSAEWSNNNTNLIERVEESM